MLKHCIVCAYKNILSLIKKFLYIINDSIVRLSMPNIVDLG